MREPGQRMRSVEGNPLRRCSGRVTQIAQWGTLAFPATSVTLDVKPGAKYQCTCDSVVSLGGNRAAAPSTIEPAFSRHRRSGAEEASAVGQRDGVAELSCAAGESPRSIARNRKGQHSIRVGEQWRLCFIWRDGNAHAVEIVDHH